MKDHYKKYGRSWWEQHKDDPKVKKKRHDYYLRTKEHHLARARKWYWKNKKRRNEIARKWELKQYGLTPETYKLMHKKQKGRCLICGLKKKPLVVDHCHSSGKVRGLLCRSCNQGIGLFKDNIPILMKAKSYLERGPHNAYNSF